MSTVHWLRQIEQVTLPALLRAAQEVCGGIVDVQFNLQRMQVEAIACRHLSQGCRFAVIESVRQALGAVISRPELVTVNVKAPPEYLFTTHFAQTSREHVPCDRIEKAGVFTVSLGELRALRKAYNRLSSTQQKFDKVATFASGGLPALIHVTDGLLSRLGTGNQKASLDAIDQSKQKFHCFPGLNWQTTGNAKMLFLSWVGGLRDGCRLLVFDTGTNGNAPRQVLKLLRSYVPTTCSFGPDKILVVGIVDGRDRRQRRRRVIVRDRRGRPRHIEVRYWRTEYIPTEDCEWLLGYEPLRHAGILHRSRVDAILKIRDAKGKLTGVIGARNAATVLSDLLAGRRSPTLLPPRLLGTAQTGTAGLLLSLDYRAEAENLRNAFVQGLITERFAKYLCRQFRRQYQGCYQSAPWRQWLKRKKTFVTQKVERGAKKSL